MAGEAPFAVRAALLNPTIIIIEIVDTVVVKKCEATLKDEMVHFLSAAEKAEHDAGSLKKFMSLTWGQFELSKVMFEKKRLQKLDGRKVEDLQYLEKVRLQCVLSESGSFSPIKVEILKDFWSRPVQPFPSHLSRVARAYWSAPVASSKSESTFSYSGEVITKKRNTLSVSLSEAMIAYDWTRQAHYSFNALVRGVFVLDEEYVRVKENRKRERQEETCELQKRLADLLQQGDDQE